MIGRSAAFAAAQIGSRSGSSTGNPSGSRGHTAATQSSPASFSIACALAAGSVAGARTMLFSRRAVLRHVAVVGVDQPPREVRREGRGAVGPRTGDDEVDVAALGVHVGEP